MVNRDGGKRTNSRTYERLKVRRQQMLSERMRGENNHMFGKKQTEESNKQRSDSLRGRKKPESQREKLRIRNSGSGNPQYGKPKNDRQLEVSRKNFLENNPMWREEVKEKIRKSKGTSVNCFDLEQNKFVRVSAKEFNELKGCKYVGVSSGKIPAEFKRN